MTEKILSHPVLRVRIFPLLLVAGGAIAILDGMHGKLPDDVGLFGRLDVLVCGLLFSLPLASRLAGRRGGLSRSRQWALAAALLAVGGSLFQLAITLTFGDRCGELTLAFWRAFVVIPVATAAVIACQWSPWEPALVALGPRAWKFDLGLLGLALLVPAVYADAVADGIRSNLHQSLQNNRLALAHRQMQQLRQLKPSWTVNGSPVLGAERELGELVSRLEREAAVPLGEHASASEIGRRVMVLVQLEKHREALRRVAPLTRGDHVHPVAFDYLALCYQRLERPRESLAAYQNALRYWNGRPDSAAKTRGVASAYKGIGFAARRLEDRDLEEQAYNRLVQIAPTAENHFLLAQSYREHQKSGLAAEHASIAMELNPSFVPQVEAMLSTLSRDHFGCLQIPRR